MKATITISLNKFLEIRNERDELRKENERLRKGLADAVLDAGMFKTDKRRNSPKESDKASQERKELESSMTEYIRFHYKLGDIFPVRQLRESVEVKDSQQSAFNNIITSWKLAQAIQKGDRGFWKVISERFFDIKQ